MYRVGNLDHHIQEILKKGALALFLKIISAALIFGFNILLARLIGAEGAGIYFLAMTVASIATLFGRVGLDDSLVRFTAANVELKNWSAVKGVYRQGMLLALGTSALTALMVWIFSSLIAERIFSKPELTVPLQWISLSIVPTSLLILHGQMLQGLKRITEYILVQWQGIIVSITSIVGILLLGKRWGTLGAIWAFIISTILTAIFGFWRWRTATPQLKTVIAKFNFNDLLKSCMPLFWVTTLNYIVNTGSTPILIGIWWTNKDVSIYSVATRTAQLTSLILIAINAIVAPKFAALYSKGELQTLGKVARQSALIGTIVAGPLLLIALIFPEHVMGIYGKEFVRGSSVLIIMAIGQFINVAVGSVAYLLKMCGHEDRLKKLSIYSAIINTVLNVSLIPLFGIVGAAVADSLTLIYRNIWSAFLVRKHININLAFFTKSTN